MQWMSCVDFVAISLFIMPNDIDTWLSTWTAFLTYIAVIVTETEAEFYIKEKHFIYSQN